MLSELTPTTKSMYKHRAACLSEVSSYDVSILASVQPWYIQTVLSDSTDSRDKEATISLDAVKIYASNVQ